MMKRFVLCLSLLLAVVASPCLGQFQNPPNLIPAPGNIQGETNWYSYGCWDTKCPTMIVITRICGEPFTGSLFSRIQQKTTAVWDESEDFDDNMDEVQALVDSIYLLHNSLGNALDDLETRCANASPPCPCCDELDGPTTTLLNQWDAMSLNWDVLKARWALYKQERAALFTGWYNRPPYEDDEFCSFLLNWINDLYDFESHLDDINDDLGNPMILGSLWSNLVVYKNDLTTQLASVQGCCNGGGPGGPMAPASASLQSISRLRYVVAAPPAVVQPKPPVEVGGKACGCGLAKPAAKPADVEQGVPTLAPKVAAL